MPGIEISTQSQTTPHRASSSGDGSSAFHRYLIPTALILSFGWSLLSNQMGEPPQAQGLNAEGFSSGRAEVLLREFLGDEKPHPVASAANKQVKERILAQLHRFGIEVEVQNTLACNAKWPVCAQVENIIAQIPGESSDAVLLMAHYDSVPGAPGAGDDGAGVAAVLEVARQLSLEGSHHNSLVIAITDAEEVGLIGAEAFFHQHPAVKNIKIVLNLEGSGSAGPVQLLRTGRDNRFVVQRYQAVIEDVAAHSMANEIFKHMPNDTDFSVAQRAGLQGIDLVFAGERNHYHTALDNVDNLDKNTLQHHGSLLLPLARDFLAEDLSNTTTGDVVYFDWFGLWVWGEEVLLPLSVAAFAVLLLVIWQRRQVAATARSTVRIVIAFTAIAGGVALTLYVLGLWVTLPAWPATQWPVLGLMYATTAAIALRFPAGLNHWSLLYGNVALWAFLTGLCSFYAPGVAPLFLAPLLQLTALIAVTAMLKDTPTVRAVSAVLAVLAIVSATVGILPLLLETQGYKMAMGLAVFPALFGSMMLCLKTAQGSYVNRWQYRSAAALAMVLLLVAGTSSMYSTWRPQHVILDYLEDRADGKANWMAFSGESVDKEFMALGSFTYSDTTVMPYFTKNPGPVASTLLTDTPSAQLDIIEDQWRAGVRTVQLQLKSMRAARKLMLFISTESGLQNAQVNGQQVVLNQHPFSRSTAGKYHALQVFTSARKGVLIQMQFDNPKAQTLIFADASSRLPVAGQALSDARRPLATTVHRGDQWTIADKLVLEAVSP